MTVKEVVTLAAGCLGREDLIAAINKTASTLTSDEKLELNSLLRCYNFVENEVALDYCPLKKEDTLNVVNNKIEFTSFKSKPVNIRKVVCGGYVQRFTTYPTYLYFPDGWQGQASVLYDYAPSEKTALDKTCEFSENTISARLLALGVSAQYCLVNGETGRAAVWDKKFRDALRAKNLLRRTVTIRSRRWV